MFIVETGTEMSTWNTFTLNTNDIQLFTANRHTA